MSRRAGSFVLGLAGLGWVLGLAAGFTTLWRYKSTPGALADGPPQRWPADSSIPRPRDLPTLVMFAHPKCPCTRASVSELHRLMSRTRDRVAARVVVLRPSDRAQWDRSALWDAASRVPGVQVVADADGREAARFHAVTSGQTLLYDAAGRLAFNGGLTAARGHEGDSFGFRRVLSILETGTADRADSPVFGCSLIGHEATSMDITRQEESP